MAVLEAGDVDVGVGDDEAAGALGGGGSAVPERDLTNEMSALSMNPSALTSSRKFELPTACPDSDLVWLISAESTKVSAFVSLISTAIEPTTALLKLLAESVTLVRVTAIVCALVTPVRFTI